MMCRVWRGETAPDKLDSYLDYLKVTGIAAYESTPGNRGTGRATFAIDFCHSVHCR